MKPVSQRPIYSCADCQSRAAWLEALLPGDVILTAHAAVSVSHVIHFQNSFQQYPATARSFTHAALYAGRGRVIHAMAEVGALFATAGGVRDDCIWDVITDSVFFVCLRAPGVDPTLHEFIIQAARGHVGLPYDYVGLARAVAYCWFAQPVARTIRMLRGINEPEAAARSFATAEAFICSEFVACVYDEVLQHKNPCNMPGGRPAGIALPCEFFVNPKFESVIPRGH